MSKNRRKITFILDKVVFHNDFEPNKNLIHKNIYKMPLSCNNEKNVYEAMLMVHFYRKN